MEAKPVPGGAKGTDFISVLNLESPEGHFTDEKI